MHPFIRKSCSLFLILLVPGLGLAAPADPHDDHDDHADHRDHDDHDDHDDHEDGVVSVPDAVLEEFGIETGVAGHGVLHEEVILPGEIRFNREAMAYATPRFAGSVTGIHVRLGDRVESGQLLATLESAETLRPFRLESPIAGTVVALEVTPGQTVEAGSALFTVADLATVWADLQVYQRDIALVREGQAVRVEGGHAIPASRGTIAYLSPTVDEHTRTGLARVVLENPAGDWKPGQFIKGRVSVDEHRADIVVPRTAVLTLEGETVVFVRTGHGFEPRPVKLGHADATSVEVLNGLNAGETIVTLNAISLKAELGKASFGGHAGHVH